MLSYYLSRIKSLYQNLTIRKTVVLIWTASNYWTALSIFIILIEILLLFYSLFLFKDLVSIVSNLKQSTPLTSDFTFSLIKTAFAGSLYVIATAFSNYIKDVQSSKVSIYVDNKIHKSADEADLAFFESPKYLDVLRRAKDAGLDRPGAIVSSIMEIVKNLLTLGGIAYVMLSISIYLLPLLILFTLPSFLLKISFAEKVLKWRISQTATERKVGYLSDLITKDTYAKEIKSYNLGNYFREMYIQFRNKLLSEKLSITKRNTLFEVLAMVMAVSCFFTCIFYIVSNNQYAQSNVGNVTIFLVVFSQSFSTMNQLTNSIARVYENNIYLASIFELFEYKSILSTTINPKKIPENLDFEINSLNFNYPFTSKPSLNNISLKIPSGKIVALVGVNGSGKSTINKLLNRLYDPTSGEIKLGDININEFDLVEYKKYVAQVFQDYGKYNFSIADNIHFGKIYSPLNMNEVKLAAEKANATDFISAYSNGFETKMGKIFEDGEEISIGQWQKLAIARAFYSDAKLLIFDEATSALDAIAEDKLFTNLRAYLGNKAALIISHRASAIQYADYVYVISDGKIVQEGNHETLSHIEGAYTTLFSKKKTSNNV